MDTQMVNFSIPKNLLKDVDRVALKTDRSRSEFLREAIRQLLENSRRKTLLFRAVERIVEKNDLSEKEAMVLAEEAKTWSRKVFQ